MRFSSFLTASALAVLAAAQGTYKFTMATIPTSISSGTVYNITWAPATGTVKLVLVKAVTPGASTVNPVMTITDSATGGSYAWSVPDTIPKGDGYALEIVNTASATDINYTKQFAIDSSTPASAASSGASTVTSVSGVSTVTSTGSSTGSATDSSSTGSASSGTSTGTRSGSTTTTRASTTTTRAATTSAGALTSVAGAQETARAGAGLLAFVGAAMLVL